MQVMVSRSGVGRVHDATHSKPLATWTIEDCRQFLEAMAALIDPENRPWSWDIAALPPGSRIVGSSAPVANDDAVLYVFRVRVANDWAMTEPIPLPEPVAMEIISNGFGDGTSRAEKPHD